MPHVRQTMSSPETQTRNHGKQHEETQTRKTFSRQRVHQPRCQDPDAPAGSLSLTTRTMNHMGLYCIFMERPPNQVLVDFPSSRGLEDIFNHPHQHPQAQAFRHLFVLSGNRHRRTKTPGPMDTWSSHRFVTLEFERHSGTMVIQTAHAIYDSGSERHPTQATLAP